MNYKFCTKNFENENENENKNKNEMKMRMKINKKDFLIIYKNELLSI